MTEKSKTVQAFVTEMTRAIRNIDINDSVQLSAFRLVAEEKIERFVKEQLKVYQQELRQKIEDRLEEMKKNADSFRGHNDTFLAHATELQIRGIKGEVLSLLP